jgi:hypothetical protein
LSLIGIFPPGNVDTLIEIGYNILYPMNCIHKEYYKGLFVQRSWGNISCYSHYMGSGVAYLPAIIWPRLQMMEEVYRNNDFRFCLFNFFI